MNVFTKYLLLVLSALLYGIADCQNTTSTTRNPENRTSSKIEHTDIDYTALYKECKNINPDILQEKAYHLVARNHVDSALALYNIAASLYANSTTTKRLYKLATIYNNIGYIYFFHFSNFQQAYTCFLKAKELCEEHEFNDLLSSILLHIGNVFIDYGDFETSMQYYREGFELCLASRDWITLQTIFFNMFSQCLEQNRIQEHAAELTAFKQAPIPDSIPMYQFSQHFCNALYHIQAQEYAQALPLFDSMQHNINTTFTPERFHLITSSMRAETFALNKEIDKAISNMLKAVELSKQYPNVDDIRMWSYRKLAQYHEQKGEKDKASEYKALALDIEDKSLSFKNLSQIHEIKSVYELGKLNEHIHELNRKKQQQTTILSIVSIGLAFILFLLSRVIVQNKKLDQKNRELFLQNKAMLRQLDEEREARKTMQEKNANAQSHDTKNVEDSSKNTKQHNENETINSIDKNQKNYLSGSLDKTRTSLLWQKIIQIMDSNPEIYSNDFSIMRLATLAESNSKYVSQTINEMSGMNFNGFLAEYRINEACRRISDRQNYGMLTLEAIGNSVGFNSRSNFINLFRKKTGLSPSEYARISKQEQNRQQT